MELHKCDAVEEDLRRGIQQLRYATPALLRRTFDFIVYGHTSDAMALFFTKILVTNAPLRVMHADVDIKKIKDSTNISDISSDVDTVILFSEYGPDYDDHFRFTFREESGDRIKFTQEVRTHLQSAGKQMTWMCDPVMLLENLSRANRFECRKVGTQFFITTLDGLEPLLRSIKSACTAAYRARTKTDQVLLRIESKLKRAPHKK